MARLPRARYTIVASILADKDIEGMLAALSALGDRFVATRSSSTRALSSPDLPRRARPGPRPRPRRAGGGGRYWGGGGPAGPPAEAIAHARAGDEALLVTGS